MPRGCTLCLGVHLQLSPIKKFLRPGGARAPSVPPGYAYVALGFHDNAGTVDS